MIKSIKKCIIFIALVMIFSMITGCTTEDRRIDEGSTPDDQQEEQQDQEDQEQAEVKKPAMPEQIQNDRSVVVYILNEGNKKEVDVEEYVAGVLGGEIHNDWPEEALKAQAILARTFVMEFLTTKTSKYQGADVSTDIEEAQAWNPENVNDRLNQAVQDTEGMVAVHDGKFIKSWFHSHSGGKTATAKEGLAYAEEEPPYIQVVESPDSEDAPEEDATWMAEFTKQEIIQAASQQGKNITSVNEIQIEETGPSNRATTLLIDGEEISVPNFRIALDSTKMKSTLITDIQVQGEKVVISGKGYGHGVGMPQWGAYALAQEGKTAQEIIQYYFKDVNIVPLWD